MANFTVGFLSSKAGAFLVVALFGIKGLYSFLKTFVNS
jgi:hypothetical protein